MLGKGFEGIPFDQVKARLIFEFNPKPANQPLVDFKGLDGMADGQQGPGEGAQARANFLHRFMAGFWQGMGHHGGQGGFGQKVLPELTEGAKAVGGQNLLDSGRVQSWRLRMACSSPGLRMP